MPRLETLILSATWTNPPPEQTVAVWPDDVAATGLLADWLIYLDEGDPLVPTALEIVAGDLVLTHTTIVAPNFPTFIELVNPASTAVDVNGRCLVTGGKFPITIG